MTKTELTQPILSVADVIYWGLCLLIGALAGAVFGG